MSVNYMSLAGAEDSPTFIVRESKEHTIYGGDTHGAEGPKIFVISKDKEAKPIYIKVPHMPYCGILVNDDTELIVGGNDGNMSKYSLWDPSIPVLIKNIKVFSNSVFKLEKMSEDRLLCGESNGNLHIVDV